MDAISRYKRMTPGSSRIFARSRRYHVNGVHHNIRYFEPYPFVTRSAAGRHLVDVDSNRYTDYWMGHWSLIMGHGPAPVAAALDRQIKRGWMHGTVNEATMKLSELIYGAVRAAEKIRYVSSGTEAVMYAVRLARAATGKKIIAKIDGGWHGYTSELLKTVNWPYDVPESGGLVGDDNIISIPYNDLEGSIRILESAGNDLACIIIEPVLGGGGCIPADADYMRGIQEYARRCGALYILDEIVTGFRFRFGCLYPEMRLDPDIVTLGKIVGGGMPVGAICGKKEIMELSNTRTNTKSARAYIGGGTFSANPATMAAGSSTLGALKKRAPAFYKKLDSLGTLARDGLEMVLDGMAQVTGKGSLFMTHFTSGEPPRSAADAAACDGTMLLDYHMNLLADSIFFLPGKLGAISAAHTYNDITELIDSSARFAGLVRGRSKV